MGSEQSSPTVLAAYKLLVQPSEEFGGVPPFLLTWETDLEMAFSSTQWENIIYFS